MSTRLGKQLGDFDHGCHKMARLRKRFFKQLQAHQEYIFQDSPGFFALEVPEQHAFRRAIRRLRYLRELGVARRAQKDDRLLQQLGRLQEAHAEKPLLAPHQDSRSQDLLDAIAAIEERWPDGRRTAVLPVAMNR